MRSSCTRSKHLVATAADMLVTQYDESKTRLHDGISKQVTRCTNDRRSQQAEYCVHLHRASVQEVGHDAVGVACQVAQRPGGVALGAAGAVPQQGQQRRHRRRQLHIQLGAVEGCGAGTYVCRPGVPKV